MRCERIVTKIKTHKPSHRRYRAPRLDIHDATAAASEDEAAPVAPAAVAGMVLSLLAQAVLSTVADAL